MLQWLMLCLVSFPNAQTEPCTRNSINWGSTGIKTELGQQGNKQQTFQLIQLLPSHCQRDCITVITKSVSSTFITLVLHMLEHSVSAVKMWFPECGPDSWKKLKGLKADEGNSGREKLYCNPILTDIPVSSQPGCWPL